MNWIINMIYANIGIGLINLVGLYFWIFPSVQWQVWLGLSVHDKYYYDALNTAVSLGRLDFITILLTTLGIMVGIFAIGGFGYIRYRAEAIAKQTANEKVTENIQIWEEYLRNFGQPSLHKDQEATKAVQETVKIEMDGESK